jgi:tetratricopeptide (TPR) repeat protein
VGLRLQKLARIAGANCAFSSVSPSFSPVLATSAAALAVAEQGTVIAQTANTLPAPSGRSVGRAMPTTFWATKARHNSIASAAWHSRSRSVSPTSFGFDQRIRALVVLFRILWLRGFSDQALEITQRVIDEAAGRDYTALICTSLFYPSMLLLWTGDLPRAGDLIEPLIAYAGRYSLEPYRALGIALKGELAISLDEPEAGLDSLRSALESLCAQQYNLLIRGFIGASAESLRKTGRFEEAMFTINGAISRAENSGVEFDLSELLRIKSQILAAQHDLNQR